MLTSYACLEISDFQPKHKKPLAAILISMTPDLHWYDSLIIKSYTTESKIKLDLQFKHHGDLTGADLNKINKTEVASHQFNSTSYPKYPKTTS